MKWSTTEVLIIVIAIIAGTVGIMYLTERAIKCENLGGVFIDGYCLEVPLIDLE